VRQPQEYEHIHKLRIHSVTRMIGIRNNAKPAAMGLHLPFPRIRPLASLLTIMLASVPLHIATLTLSPPVWIDEIMILDYGRVLCEPNTHWGMTFNAYRTPAYPLTPLYCYLDWKWGEWFGFSPFSIRMLATLSAFASTILFYYLISSFGLSPWASSFSAMAFWFDDILNGSFHGGRADAFTLGLAFAACWAWQKSLVRHSRFLSFFSGLIAGAAVLSWPTAVVTLILAPFCYLVTAIRARSWYI